MLTQREVDGATILLNQLSEDDLVSLAQTVTKGLIETPSKKGLS